MMKWIAKCSKTHFSIVNMKVIIHSKHLLFDVRVCNCSTGSLGQNYRGTSADVKLITNKVMTQARLNPSGGFSPRWRGRVEPRDAKQTQWLSYNTSFYFPKINTCVYIRLYYTIAHTSTSNYLLELTQLKIADAANQL